MPGRRSSDDLLVELDGADATPNAVDAKAVLELGAAYLDLLERVARADGRPISFKGIAVVDKCVAFKVQVSDPVAAQAAVTNSSRLVYGGAAVPQGLVSAVERLRKAIRERDDAGQQVTALVGRKKSVLRLADARTLLPPEASLTVRARVVQVGGEHPRAKFESGSEAASFALRLTEQLATELAAHLYKIVDIEAVARRDPEGNIVDGRLDRFHPVVARDQFHRLTRWMTDASEAAS
ncbi:MAG: hypothetical protein JNK82_36005 [Myxococcaceae bacterium]|nr:hypothetical protein [Myxococcaceae bacterium]